VLEPAAADYRNKSPVRQQAAKDTIVCLNHQRIGACTDPPSAQCAPSAREPVQVSRPSRGSGRGQHQTRSQQPRRKSTNVLIASLLAWSRRRYGDRRNAEESAEPKRNDRRQLREAARLPAMSARGRLVSGLVTIVVALAGFMTAGALPAAAIPGTIQYVALGDSYAAGTASQLGGCPQSRDGYPALLDRKESRIDLTANATCSGATTTKVADTLPSALNGDTRLVTLTVGAADLGLSAVLAACLPGPSKQCDIAISNAQGLLGDCPGGESRLGDRLIELYGEVAEAAPRARIVVTGYPLLFESPAAGDPRAAINEATTDLNCVIERAVAATNDADVNIHYVDVTEEFAGHGIGSTKPSFIHDLFSDNGLPDPEAFHPNAAGYRAYAEAIKTKLPGGWLDKQQVLV